MRTRIHCRKTPDKRQPRANSLFGVHPLGCVYRGFTRVGHNTLKGGHQTLARCIAATLLCLLAGCSKPKHAAPASAAFADLNPAVTARFQSMTNPVEVVTPRRVDELFTLGPGDRVEIEI